VVKGGGQPLLMVEPDELNRSLEIAGFDEPQRDRSAKRYLRGLVNGSGRTDSDQALDPEGTDPGPRRDLELTYPANSRFPLLMLKKWKIRRPDAGFTHQTSASA